MNTLFIRNHLYSILIILLFLLFLPFFLYPKIIGNDGVGYFVYLRSLVFDGDLDFSNEYQHYSNEYRIVGYSPVTQRPVNGVPPGTALLWSPFYLVAHGVVSISQSLGYPIAPKDGYSYPYVWAIAIGSAIYGLLGLLICYRICILFLPSNISFMAVVLGWLASPLFFYQYLHPSMSHANSFFMASLFFYLLIRIFKATQAPYREWLIVGIVCGLTTLIRNQDGIFILLPILLALFPAKRKWFPVSIFLIVIGFLIGFFPQFLAWKALFGSYFSGPESHQLGANSDFLNSHLLGVLFSGRHGLFTWHPILFLGLLGWVGLYKKERMVTLGIILIFIMEVWVIGSWKLWWGAHSFGHRMFLSLLPLFILGLAFGIESLSRKIKPGWLWGMGIVFILWNFGLIYQYVFNLYDRDGLTPFIQIIQNQIILLPKSFILKILHHL